MITQLNTSNFSRVESIVIHGVSTLSSSYNHNYFHNKITDEIILEVADDDQTCYYYLVFGYANLCKKTYLGLCEDEYGFGIFDEEYNGYPSRDENGVIELDDTDC